MLTPKQIDALSKLGWNDATILEVDAFLDAEQGAFYNLADIGGGDYRLMYRIPTDKIEKGEVVMKMECKLARIPN